MKKTVLLLIAVLIVTVSWQPAPTPTPEPTPVPPTPTAIPPTSTPMPSTATPTRVSPTPTALPKDARGFSILETEHTTVLAQLGVSDDRAREVGAFFEIGYQVVGEDLGYADKRPRLYVYRSEDDLFQDLIATWGYSEWYKTNRAIPRMRSDYVMWIPPLPHGDGLFVGHEYSHRIIEQIAGVNSQVNFKWFDEGLAEYEGLKALAKQSPDDALVQRDNRLNQVLTASANGAGLHLRDMTTEEQWDQLIASQGNAYPQAWAAMDYLISQRGMAQVRSVLTLVGKGQAFSDAFQKVYGLTVDDFEKEFLTYVGKLKEESDSALCSKIDGQADDWQKLKPVIVDVPNPAIARAADVHEVYAVTCKGALYVMITVDGPANSGPVVSYSFDVDTNGDGTPEYQAGFDRTRAWLWDLRGTGYADQTNLSFPAGASEAVSQVAESMFPLKLLDNATAPRIRVYTNIANQTVKRKTVWGLVLPLGVATNTVTPTRLTVPIFGTVVCSSGFDETANTPINPSPNKIVAAGTSRIYASWSYQVPDLVPYKLTWYLNGNYVTESQFQPKATTRNMWVGYWSTDGRSLQTGSWQFQLKTLVIPSPKFRR